MAGCKVVGLDKVGPLSVVNRVITPISSVLTSLTHLFLAIYRSILRLGGVSLDSHDVTRSRVVSKSYITATSPDIAYSGG